MIKVLIPAVILCFGIAAATASVKSNEETEDPASAEDIVAWVEGKPISFEDVVAHLQPAEPWVGTKRPADPRKQALDDAVRVELFVQEAVRQGLKSSLQNQEGPPAVVEAELVQALIKRELRGKSRVTANDISDTEARTFYNSRPEISTKPGSVELSAIVVDSREEAQRLLLSVKDSSNLDFARLARDRSLHESSRSAGGKLTTLNADDSDDEVEKAISRVGYSMLEAGQVGLARTSDNRYYILKATAVERKPRDWNKTTEKSVKNFIAQRNRERIMSEFEDRLRKTYEVRVDKSVLYNLRTPTWEEHS